MELNLKNGVYYLDFGAPSAGGVVINQIIPLNITVGAPLGAQTGLAPARVHALQPAGGMLWQDFRAWFEAYLKSTLGKISIRQDTRMLNTLEAFRKPAFLEELTPEYLLDYKSWMLAQYPQGGQKGWAAVNRRIDSFKKMMRRAEDFSKISKTQNWNLVKKNRARIGRVVWHPLEELRQIADVLHGDWLTVFYLGWKCGLRKGEIAYLHKTDYDPEKHTVSITPKAGWRPKTKASERTVPIPPEAEAALKNSIALAPADSPYIINVRCKTRRDKPGYLSVQYRQILKPRLRHIKCFLHKLRHTYGSLLAQKGVPLKTIMLLMGHTNILQTSRYTHYDDGSRSKAVLKLPSLD